MDGQSRVQDHMWEIKTFKTFPHSSHRLSFPSTMSITLVNIVCLFFYLESAHMGLDDVLEKVNPDEATWLYIAETNSLNFDIRRSKSYGPKGLK